MRFTTLVTAAAALALVAELGLLVRSRAIYSRRELAKIFARPILQRPDRPGHFVGNALRFSHRRFRVP